MFAKRKDIWVVLCCGVRCYTVCVFSVYVPSKEALLHVPRPLVKSQTRGLVLKENGVTDTWRPGLFSFCWVIGIAIRKWFGER